MWELCSVLANHHISTIQYEGSQSNSQSAVDKETEQKLKVIDEAFQKNNENVIEKLLQRVTETKAELHRNLQKA